MDSLLASYASSDEEEEEEEEEAAYQQKQSHEPSSSKTAQPSSLSFFLPKPKSLSSSTFSLPPPKSSSVGTFSLPPPKSSSSGIFSLPPPKSSSSGISSGFSSLPLPESNNPTPTLPSSDPSRKRVVQFKPPINPSLLKPPEEDDDDEEEDRKPIKGRTSSTETSSVKSFFSSLPAPKNSLGLGSGSAPSLGAGRKSIVETLEPVTNFDGVQSNDNGVPVPSKFGERGSSQQENLVDESSLEVENLTSGSDASNWEQGNEVYGSYGYDGGYGNYGGSYGTYDGSTAVGINSGAAESSGMVESFMRKQGKRGRSEIPTEIVEVKQDELMKNRPREDQVKTTGIAFGPAYQPVSTAKGKPTKLHKRKHQIGTLYHDMKSKEMELNERRAKGFLTKAETQAKYGW